MVTGASIGLSVCLPCRCAPQTRAHETEREVMSGTFITRRRDPSLPGFPRLLMDTLRGWIYPAKTFGDGIIPPVIGVMPRGG
ncbi:MAG: hypothetical protein JXA20_17780 [Spirochaetes bacterium]|nr:hypothetical protein [Spirochaetota bacterium]